MKRLLYFAAIWLFISSGKTAQYDVKELKCLVCEATIEEFEIALNKLDPLKKVEVGGYQIDSKGNLKQKSVPASHSEVHLSEMLDDVCERMDDYVRATWKDNGTLTLLKMIVAGGGMNPDMSNVDFIQDEDLNKSLKYYCELVLEEHEDSIISYYVNNKDNVATRVCSLDAKLCKKTLPDSSENKEEL